MGMPMSQNAARGVWPAAGQWFFDIMIRRAPPPRPGAETTITCL